MLWDVPIYRRFAIRDSRRSGDPSLAATLTLATRKPGRLPMRMHLCYNAWVAAYTLVSRYLGA